MGDFGVENELGFIWVEGAVRFFFLFNPCSLSGHNMTIRPLN